MTDACYNAYASHMRINLCMLWQHRTWAEHGFDGQDIFQPCRFRITPPQFRKTYETSLWETKIENITFRRMFRVLSQIAIRICLSEVRVRGAERV